MIRKTSVALACVFILAGCSSDDDPSTPLGSNAPMGDDPALSDDPTSMPPAADDLPVEDQAEVTPDTDGPPDAGSGSVAARVLTPSNADGSINTFWSCDDQNDQTVFELVFFDDTTGAIALSETDIRDMSWQESPLGSLLMTVDTQGDSMIQSVTFLEDEEAFTATDSSIAGTSFGPVTCFLDGGDGNGNGEDVVITGPGPSDGGQDARIEAIEESLNENDGTESSADVILASIVNGEADFWSCRSDDDSLFSLAFSADQSGAVAVGEQNVSFSWEVPSEAAGLVLMSLQAPSDSAIAGLSVVDADSFTARLVRFSNSSIDGSIGGQAACIRNSS